MKLWRTALALCWVVHAYVSALGDAAMEQVLAPDASPWLAIDSNKSLLSRILIPRVSGTQESAKVREILSHPFREAKNKHGKSKWHIEIEPFEARTPLGERTFANVILTRDPDAARKLVLAAHYDSKYFPPGSAEEGFVGATDSAFPCAMLVDVAMALDAPLDAYTANRTAARRSYLPAHEDVTLQIVFFDGEEAMHQWSSTDSIYGARHLASQWLRTWDVPAWPPSHAEPRHVTGNHAPIRRIHSINHFVLLDLLGSPNASVPYYFGNTRHLHSQFHDIEGRLLMQKRLWPEGAAYERLFRDERGPSGIGDDHVPFLQQGVPILHMIPYPFPSVWHTKDDNKSALDQATLYAWTRILRIFTAEYLGLA